MHVRSTFAMMEEGGVGVTGMIDFVYDAYVVGRSNGR